MASRTYKKATYIYHIDFRDVDDMASRNYKMATNIILISGIQTNGVKELQDGD